MGVTASYSKDGINWTIKDESAYRAVRLMVKNVTDFRPYWPRIEEAIHADVKQRFATRDGGSWRPLTPKYARWKARHGGGQLMVLSGGMLASFTEKGAPGQKVRRGPREMLFRSDYKILPRSKGGATPLATFHFYASQRKAVNENSPFLRTRLGLEMSAIALEWKRQWDRGS